MFPVFNRLEYLLFTFPGKKNTKQPLRWEKVCPEWFNRVKFAIISNSKCACCSKMGCSLFPALLGINLACFKIHSRFYEKAWTWNWNLKSLSIFKWIKKTLGLFLIAMQFIKAVLLQKLIETMDGCNKIEQRTETFKNLPTLDPQSVKSKRTGIKFL